MEIYTKRGGIRIGQSFWRAANFTIPFVELKLGGGAVCIKYLFREITIPLGNVKSVRKKWGLFSPGVQIIHDVEGLEPFILFWSFSVGLVLEKFREYGYPVSLPE